MSHPRIDEMVYSFAPEPDRGREAVDSLVREADRFSSTVRAESRRLAEAREEILRDARRQAAEFRREADEEIESILAEAQSRAATIVATAEQRAADLMGKAREEAADLATLAGRYRTALHAAVETLQQLPAVSPTPDEQTGA